MARYTITNLNYMTSGSTRGLVNIDYSLDSLDLAHIHLLGADEGDGLSGVVTESGPVEWVKSDYIKQYENSEKPALALQDSEKSAVLNEHQPFPKSAEPRPFSRIRIFKECDLKSDQADRDRFNRTQVLSNQVFQFEKNQADNDKAVHVDADGRTFSPMYSLTDLCVKSAKKKMAAKNDAIYDFGENQATYTAFDEQPVCFCQTANGNACVLSRPTSKLGYAVQTSTRTDSAAENDYTVSLKQVGEGTCVYKPSTSFPKTVDDETCNEYFEPNCVMRGVEYSQIVDLDQNSGENPTVYDAGDTYGDVYTSKSHLDPQYGMKSDRQCRIDNCRTYCGLHKSNEYVVLKYYDDVNYESMPPVGDARTESTAFAEKRAVFPH